jgi:hypothetical protein
MEGVEMHRGFGGKPEGKKSHARPTCRWENNIKMHVKQNRMGEHRLD